jgi:AraC-like DNA-binding protein
VLETPFVQNGIWARQLAEKLKVEGYPTRSILAEAGLDLRLLNTNGAMLPFERIATFFERASEVSGDDCLGFRFAQTRDVRDAGLLGYIGLSSPTVLAALRNLERYSRIFSDAIEFRSDDLEETGVFSWRFRASATVYQRQFTEFSITNVVQTFRALTGRPLIPLQVAFSHPRNAHLKDFDTYFGCTVEFAAPRNQIQFRLSDLQLQLRTADDRLLEVLQENCRDVLSRREAAAPSLIERVERLIVDRLTSGEARLETIATELGMSSRTLSRRLAGLNTSFNDIVDELRRELALAYLQDSTFSLTEIAFLLGYAEAAGFTTAFKRWTGITPGQARLNATRSAIAPPRS